MAAESTANVDARGRRKSSPAANEFYARKILQVDDPDGSLEDEINRIAKRYGKAKAAGAISQEIALKERLVAKCMRFYFITGPNVGTREDGVLHEGDYAQVDDIFIDALLKTIDSHDASIGLFTHQLANKYAMMRTDAAYKAARQDTEYGGSITSAPIMLDAPARRNDDGKSTTVGDLVAVCVDAEHSGETDESFSQQEREEDLRETVDATDALEEEGAIAYIDGGEAFAVQADAIDNAILLKTISLISGFLGKSGRAANDTRKLYTRMFFSETLTRVTKVSTEGELAPLQKNEKELLGAVELPFQDTYTAERCRTIMELWAVDFVEGVPQIKRPLNDRVDKLDEPPDYGWNLPAKVFVAYLESLGTAASDALVSQQRSHYDKLLHALKS